MSKTLLMLAVGLLVPGCIIGTWPTPDLVDGEEDERMSAVNYSGQNFIGTEPCDEIDNDADGTVDEGCECDGVARGCIGLDGGQCGFGVQWCADGYWGGCTSAGPPYSPQRTRSLDVVELTPDPIPRNGEDAIRVVVSATPVCYGVQIPEFEVTLSSSDPVMRVKGVALDDGLGQDAVALDGNFTTTLPNPFGPGVPDQTLTLRVEAEINSADAATTATVELEAP